MRFPHSPKLRLAPLWPALAALLTTAGLLVTLLPRLIEEGAAEDLLVTARALAPTVAERLAGGETGAQDWATSAAAGTGLRITLIRADGVVFADSARSTAELGTMENHAQRPEVVGAMARGEGTAVRQSDTTGVQYVYAARTLSLPRGNVVFFRLAQPIARLSLLHGQLTGTLLLATAAAMLVMGLVSWWLSRRLFRPLSQLVEGADTLANRQFGHRLSVPDERELSTLAQALNRLATQVEEQIQNAEAERDHLRSILASMSEGVLVTDTRGRALLANPAFLRLFGLPGEVVGRSPIEITRHPLLEQLVTETLRRGEPATGELEQETPERRTLSLTSAALGARAGAVVVARDISPFTRLSEIRRDFVANVSHELKTPLAAIRGYAETLRDGALDDAPTAQRFTGRILQQCRRLQALLDDLLTLSRLESLGAVPEPGGVDLAALVRRSAELVAPLAQERGVELRVENGGAPEIAGDADSLERLLLNLLDNAIKYNRAGGQVSIRVGHRPGFAVIEVADSGIGIPADSLPRIFERFYRVDKGRSREEGGTGLGLAIVKHVAQGHGGRVEVESELGRGSTFRVLLPSS